MSDSLPPSSRQDWACLNWKEAQTSVAQLLHSNGYMKFEERVLGGSKRADILVMNDSTNEVYFGIVEVKCYQKVNQSLITSSIQQAIRYLNHFYQEISGNGRWQSKDRHFFVATVFTNDYPVIVGERKLGENMQLVNPDLLKEDFDIIITSPDLLTRRLAERGLLPWKQTDLGKYFQPM